MTFFEKLKKQEDTDFHDEDEKLEEQYQKMFKKIARDFATIKDVKEFVERDDGIYRVNGALSTALEYRRNEKRKLSEKAKYRDIDELDWIYGESNE